MTANEPQHLVSTFGKCMLADGLTKGTGGSISVRAGSETVAISSSGMLCEEIESEDVLILDINGERVAGNHKSSSKFRMHTDVLRQREDVGAMVHNHSPYVSVFASINESVGPSYYLITFVGDEIPVASYETCGTAELADMVAEMLGDNYNTCLFEKHGVLATGATAKEACEVALTVEYCARIHYQARNAGKPLLPPDEEIDTLLDRFADYGQTQSADEDGPDPTGDRAPADRLSDPASYRSAISEFGYGMLHQGLTEGTGGNISAQTDDLAAISPSGMPYDEIESEDVPAVTLDGKLVTGDRKPSSEVCVYIGTLREREDAGAVVHNHFPYASTFASLGELIPASHYLIAFAGDEISVVGYEAHGTQGLADLVLEALDDDCNACFLENHGVVAVGDSVTEAYEVAPMVEYCTRIHYQALNIGEPSLSPDEEVDTLLGRSADYEQGH